MNLKNNIIPITIIVIILVIGFIYYSSITKDDDIRSVLKQDSIKFELLNNKINKIDSVNNILYKQDSIQTLKINALKKTYYKRKEDINTNRNSLPILPNF